MKVWKTQYSGRNPLNRRLLVTLSLSALLLTGCNNVSTDESASSNSNSGASAVESGLAFQEKAKQAAKTLEENPLKDLDSTVTK
jgi:hypothetical protein